jgi:hypothetical protein
MVVLCIQARLVAPSPGESWDFGRLVRAFRNRNGEKRDWLEHPNTRPGLAGMKSLCDKEMLASEMHGADR